MATFPALNPSEPPPLDPEDESEEDSSFSEEVLRGPGGRLRLDLTSAEPSPVSTPRKGGGDDPRPPSKRGVVEDGGMREEEEDFGVDVTEEVVVGEEELRVESVVEAVGDGSSGDGDGATDDRSEEETTNHDDEEGVEEEMDFGDFSTVQSPPEPEGKEEEGPIAVTPPEDQVEEDDDDFGDFSSTPAAPASEPVAPPAAADDFADFEASSFGAHHPPPPPSEETTRRLSLPPLALEEKFEGLIKILIPKDDDDEPSTSDDSRDPKDSPLHPLETLTTGDATLTHTLDFEGSRALTHKWPNSSSQQELYRSLSVDASTIVWTERWGTIEVPRFASGIGTVTLLQPEIRQPSKISLEAQEIISRIPDLSFMRAKTLVYPQQPATSIP